MDWASTPATPDFLSVRSALANTARKKTFCGMSFIVKHGRSDLPDPVCELASQTNTILITCLFTACCAFKCYSLSGYQFASTNHFFKLIEQIKR